MSMRDNLKSIKESLALFESFDDVNEARKRRSNLDLSIAKETLKNLNVNDFNISFEKKVIGEDIIEDNKPVSKYTYILSYNFFGNNYKIGELVDTKELYTDINQLVKDKSLTINLDELDSLINGINEETLHLYEDYFTESILNRNKIVNEKLEQLNIDYLKALKERNEIKQEMVQIKKNKLIYHLNHSKYKKLEEKIKEKDKELGKIVESQQKEKGRLVDESEVTFYVRSQFYKYLELADLLEARNAAITDQLNIEKEEDTMDQLIEAYKNEVYNFILADNNFEKIKELMNEPDLTEEEKELVNDCIEARKRYEYIKQDEMKGKVKKIIK